MDTSTDDLAPGATPLGSERLRDRLATALEPLELQVEDDSALHAGHVGAQEGGHYRVRIVSASFVGLPPLARHRLVYAALGDLRSLGVHALSIDARLPP
jgi:BolA protein